MTAQLNVAEAKAKLWAAAVSYGTPVDPEWRSAGTIWRTATYGLEVLMRGPAILFSMTLTFGLSLAASEASAGDCPGGAATAGSVVHGPVLQIPNGSIICVALGQSPSTWIAVNLPPSGISHQVMMAAAFGKNATCIVASDGLGECLIETKPLASETRERETVLTAASWH